MRPVARSEPAFDPQAIHKLQLARMLVTDTSPSLRAWSPMMLCSPAGLAPPLELRPHLATASGSLLGGRHIFEPANAVPHGVEIEPLTSGVLCAPQYLSPRVMLDPGLLRMRVAYPPDSHRLAHYPQ